MTALCWARSHSAMLYGTVERSGQGIAGARIMLRHAESHDSVAEVTTSANGAFSFVGVAWGEYELDVALDKRTRGRIQHIRLEPDSTIQVNVHVRVLPDRRIEFSPTTVNETVAWQTGFTSLSTNKLPNARNIWSLLETEEPATVTNQLDIAGLETGTPALFGALGASWTENQYYLNGLDVTDAYQTGLPNIYPDFDALGEFHVLEGAKPASRKASGEDVSLDAPEMRPGLHGALRAFYSGNGLQSGNLNARLRRFNFPGAERLNNLIDTSAQLSGELPAQLGALPFFGSVTSQQLSKTLGGFSAPINARVYGGMIEIVPLRRASHQLDVLYSAQHTFNSAEGATLFNSPESTLRASRSYQQAQSEWTQSLCPAAVLRATFGFSDAHISSRLQDGVLGASAMNLPLMTLTGPAPLGLSGGRKRVEAQTLVQWFVQGIAGTHSLSAGFGWERAWISNLWNATGGMQQILVNNVGSEIIRWNTPAKTNAHVQNVAQFIEDSWRPTRWLSFPLGVRIDSSTGQAQGTIAGISWTTIEPRAGVVIPLRPRGLSLRAGWARYGHLLQGRYLDWGNSSALGGQIFRWNDFNRDGVFQLGEQGQLLQVFGGPYSALGRGLSRPTTDEYTFGAEQDLGSRLSLLIRFYRRDEHHLIAQQNIGVPFSDYMPVKVLDPGNDGVFGTVDDQVLTLYNRIPSALGRDFLVLSNSGLHARAKGLEAEVVKHLLRSWDFSVAFTAESTAATTSPGNSPFTNDTGYVGSLGTDPNTYLNGGGWTYFDRAFTGKVTAYYAAPFGIHLGTVASYYDGVPFARMLFVSNFNQGPFFVRATPTGHPGGFQTELNATVDIRVGRDFKFQKSTVSAYLDVFNLLNANSNTRELDLTAPAFLTRIPLAVEAPRTARVGLEWKF